MTKPRKVRLTTIKMDSETAAYLKRLARETPLQSRPLLIRELVARYGETVRDELIRPLGEAKPDKNELEQTLDGIFGQET